MNAKTNNETTDKTLFLEKFENETYTITMDDIEKVLIYHDRSNANVPHSPESTMMTLAGMLQKEYAMRKMYSGAVSTAHRVGDIHLHNADMPSRLYSMQYSEVVMINGELWPIGNLFDTQKQLEILEDRDLAIDVIGNSIRDANGPTKISRFMRHKNSKKMKFISLENGKNVVCTEDHPFTINGVEIQAKDLTIGDVLETSKLVREDWMFKVNNVNGFELTPDFGWLMGLFITDGCYDKSNCGTWIITQNEGEILTRAMSILDDMGMKYVIKDVLDSNCKQIGVYSKAWVDLFYDTFGITKGSKYKCLPPSVLKFNESFINGLISGVVDGDGCVLPDEYGCTINIGVASRSLTNQLQLVLEVLGIKTYCHMQLTDKVQICTIHGKERIMRQTMPVFRMSFRTTEDVVKNICKDSIKLKNKNITKFSVYRDEKRDGTIKAIKDHPIIDENVYDFTTESEHFLVNGIRVHNCSGHSPSYIGKFGLSLPNLNSIAKPAKHADVFLEQLIKFAASMQGHFSGAIGFDAVNTFIAPYLVGLSDEKVKQCAQILVYEFAQQAVARGGQVVFSDLNLYWGVPNHYKNVMAIGPGGDETGSCYKEYDEEAKRFMRALMQVYYEGDGAGRPFFFPKADCHITAESVDDEEYMNMLGSVASKMGSPYFVFDRGTDPSISQCCRLKLSLSKSDVDELKTPWKSRFTALQNVTMNLPAFAYQAKGDESVFNEILYKNMMLAKDAHQEKFNFIDRLFSLGAEGPLNLLLMEHDGSPYVRYDKIKFLIGMVGLNEAVQVMCGEELHESKEAYMLGMKLVAQMNANCKDVSKELGFTTILEQTPAESTAYRFARLDAGRYGEDIYKYHRGSKEAPYYTNSTYLNVGANISPIERIKKEGKMHPLIDAGAISHIWMGEHTPSPESVAEFVRKTFYNTQNGQIAFSPEFTSCNTCSKTSKGLLNNCPSCGSERVRHASRVTGFFSFIDGWNAGKKQELKDRHRVTL